MLFRSAANLANVIYSIAAPGSHFAVLIVNAVLTELTFGAAVRFADNEILKCHEIRSDAFQEKVRFAGEHIGFPHDFPLPRTSLECYQVGLRLALQPDEGESGKVKAKPGQIENCVIAGDDPRPLQLADAPQARRRREANPLAASSTLVIRPSFWSSARMRQSVASSLAGMVEFVQCSHRRHVGVPPTCG